MDQYFDAFIPGIWQDESVKALHEFCDRIGCIHRFYDKQSNVFSLSLKNTIYSLDGNHYWEDADSEAPISKFLKEFRATPLESYQAIEIFCKPEDEGYWHPFAHDGKSRKCCHTATEEAAAYLEEAHSLRREVDGIQAQNIRLRTNFQSEVNRVVSEKLALWNAMPVVAK